MITARSPLRMFKISTIASKMPLHHKSKKNSSSQWTTPRSSPTPFKCLTSSRGTRLAFHSLTKNSTHQRPIHRTHQPPISRCPRLRPKIWNVTTLTSIRWPNSSLRQISTRSEVLTIQKFRPMSRPWHQLRIDQPCLVKWCKQIRRLTECIWGSSRKVSQNPACSSIWTRWW